MNDGVLRWHIAADTGLLETPQRCAGASWQAEPGCLLPYGKSWRSSCVQQASKPTGAVEKRRLLPAGGPCHGQRHDARPIALIYIYIYINIYLFICLFPSTKHFFSLFLKMKEVSGSSGVLCCPQAQVEVGTSTRGILLLPSISAPSATPRHLPMPTAHQRLVHPSRDSYTCKKQPMHL